MVDDDPEPAKKQTCVDCGDVSPLIATNYTLIGTHGWRLTRRTTTGAELMAEWRCPACWIAFKRGSRPPR